MDRASLPVVSVVVVNYRGAEDTITCVRGLAEVDYPAELLQVIVVDNEAHDFGRLKSELSGLPGVKIVKDDRNLGFAGGCNLGVEYATGDVLAFLNNDARADRNWIKTAIRVFHAEPTVGAVASKVLDWDGNRIDFVDGGLTWFGMGYKRHVGEVDDGSHDAPRDVLFGTGSALFVRASLYRELGGFDERFFMFYEDVDLGWRLNLRGWRVRYEPASLTFHRHHASMSSIDHSRELYLLERNALATLYKNFSDETLARVLPGALALVVRRATARGEIDAKQLEITRRPADPADDRRPAEIPRQSLAGFLAIDQFVEMMPLLAESRRIEQASRRMSDVDLVPLMRKALEPAYDIGRYIVAHDILVEALGIDEVFGKPRKILVITGDAISERMAGPAIRAWHMADVLSGEHEVRLITTNPLCDPPDAPFVIEGVKLKQLPENVKWADVIVLQGHALEMASELKQPGSTKIVVCDIYDPMHLELLEQSKDDSDEKRAADLKSVTRVLTNQLERGDFFLCASERQRHFWLGHLAALGRLTPTLYDNDPTTESLLGIVPFGLSGKPPQRTGPAIKGVVPGVTDADKVVIWAGGVYSWFDPLSLIRAMGHLRERQPSAKLYFLGMKHPNPEVPDMDIAGQTRSLAASLGLTGENVFFNNGWVPYTERQNWLLDANCGVTTHYEHVETTFAFRTRVLDYLWAGLPIVTTSGDSFADLVLHEGLGVVVPPEDPEALADALEKVLYDEEFAAACRERIAVVRERFTWETALAPLAEFCRNPRPAADRLQGSGLLVRTPGLSTSDKVKRDLRLVREYLDAGGPTELAKRATGRLRKIARGGRNG